MAEDATPTGEVHGDAALHDAKATGRALAWPPVRNTAAERFVGDVWSAFQREGASGVLAYAAAGAVWQPHSARKRTFGSTAEYRDYLDHVPVVEQIEADATGIWSHADVVVVRGRMRIKRDGGTVEDTRMYWLFVVEREQLVRVGSSPDLAGLLRDAGHPDPVLAREAFIALHRAGGIEPGR